MNVPATTPPNTQTPGPTSVAKVTTVYVTVAAPTPTIATTTDLGRLTPGPVGDYATTALLFPSASPVAPTAVPPPPMLGPSTGNVHTGGITHPNQDQITTIWVAAVMLLAIMIGWNMIVIRSLLYPWKMLVNLIHEASHVLVAILTGANVYSITIDPDKGPISSMTAGQPFAILSAGYIGSILIGSTMIMTAFDISASKVTSLTLFPLLIVCFWFGRTWARIQVLGCIGLTIGFWFIDQAAYLRYHILFIGVMCAFYVLWDAFDDLLFRKENESDAALFARMTSPTIHAWVLIWLTSTLVVVSLAILGGLHFFDKPVDVQRLAQAGFLPT